MYYSSSLEAGRQNEASDYRYNENMRSDTERKSRTRGRKGECNCTTVYHLLLLLHIFATVGGHVGYSVPQIQLCQRRHCPSML